MGISRKCLSFAVALEKDYVIYFLYYTCPSALCATYMLLRQDTQRFCEQKNKLTAPTVLTRLNISYKMPMYNRKSEPLIFLYSVLTYIVLPNFFRLAIISFWCQNSNSMAMGCFMGTRALAQLHAITPIMRIRTRTLGHCLNMYRPGTN